MEAPIVGHLTKFTGRLHPLNRAVLASEDRGLHDQVTRARSRLRLKYAAGVRQGGGQRHCAGHMLPCVQSRDGEIGVGGDRRQKVDRIHGRVIENVPDVTGGVPDPERRGRSSEAIRVAVHGHHSCDLRVGKIEGTKAAPKPRPTTATVSPAP